MLVVHPAVGRGPYSVLQEHGWFRVVAGSDPKDGQKVAVFRLDLVLLEVETVLSDDLLERLVIV